MDVGAMEVPVAQYGPPNAQFAPCTPPKSSQKIQDNDEEDSEFEYRIAINSIEYLYNQGYNSNDGSSMQGELNKLYLDYHARLDKQINQTKDNNKRAKLVKRKLNFKYQVERLNQEYNGKLKVRDNPNHLGVLTDESVSVAINQFGLEKARNLNDFNARWQTLMNHMKKNRANSDATLPKVYDVPGMQQYLAKLYEQLKLKYIK